jgi:hypothetical protein
LGDVRMIQKTAVALGDVRMIQKLERGVPTTDHL